jgi:hypothetical protein
MAPKLSVVQQASFFKKWIVTHQEEMIVVDGKYFDCGDFYNTYTRLKESLSPRRRQR